MPKLYKSQYSLKVLMLSKKAVYDVCTSCSNELMSDLG